MIVCREFENEMKFPLWSTANDHFKAAFSNAPITESDIDSNIKTMNDIIYTYFVDNCGKTHLVTEMIAF